MKTHDLILVLTVCLSVCCGCGGRSNFHCKLAGEYYLWCSSSVDVQIAPKIRDGRTLIIPSTVREVAWDERFILAKRSTRTPSEAAPVYWIMDVVAGQLCGPLDERTFALERSRLSVPSSLTLRPIEVFRHTENNPLRTSEDLVSGR